MADWSTIASLGTAAGTLVLAAATFSSVRASQRSSRIAEQALSLNLRPLLHASRATDPAQKVRFAEGRYVKVDGGRAAVERDGDAFYLVIPLRNVGSGVGVLHGWRLGHLDGFSATGSLDMERPALESFRSHTRDLYIPRGDIGFWQGAIRRPDDPFRPEIEAAVDNSHPLFVDLLYGDEVGGQRTISRFVLDHRDGWDSMWLPEVVRHWFIDTHGPRE
jgi:hypothetical protein